MFSVNASLVKEDLREKVVFLGLVHIISGKNILDGDFVDVVTVRGYRRDISFASQGEVGILEGFFESLLIVI